MGIDMTSGYPKSLQAWLAACFGLELGLAVLAFAMTWTASAYGPDTASAVLTLTVAPAVVLGLLGGLLADRVGPRRTMIVSSLGLVAISVILAAVAWGAGTSPALLFVIAALMGTASAFFRPASAVFARLFVADRELGTAMARVGMAGQLARTIGPPLGGFLIGMLTLAGVAWIGAAGAAVMLCVLLLIRVPRRVQPSDVRLGVRGILDAISAVRSRKDVPALLASVAIIAGAVIPVVALGIPLAARERGWSAGEAGLIEAGWIAWRARLHGVVRLEGNADQRLEAHVRRPDHHRLGPRSARDRAEVGGRAVVHGPRRRGRRPVHCSRVPDIPAPGTCHHVVAVSESTAVCTASSAARRGAAGRIRRGGFRGPPSGRSVRSRSQHRFSWSRIGVCGTSGCKDCRMDGARRDPMLAERLAAGTRRWPTRARCGGIAWRSSYAGGGCRGAQPA